jgi:hypothetical protein
VRETIEQENMTYEEEKRRVARVFETAGGFSPNIGILGGARLDTRHEEPLGPLEAGGRNSRGLRGDDLRRRPCEPRAASDVQEAHEQAELRALAQGDADRGSGGDTVGHEPRYFEEKLRVFVEAGDRRNSAERVAG